MNWQTILTLSVLCAVVVAIIVKAAISRKKGKSSCSCGCKECAFRDKCGSEK